MTIHDREQNNWTQGHKTSPRLFSQIVGLVAIGLFACMVWAVNNATNRVADEVSQCSILTEDSARLACYDKAATPPAPAKGAVAPLHFNDDESR